MLALLLIVVAVLAFGWLVTFPIRLAFRLVFGILGVILRLVFSPLILLVVGCVAVAAFVLGALAHIVPLLLVGLGVWAVYRLVSGRCVSTI
jgi:hypothetical protein